MILLLLLLTSLHQLKFLYVAITRARKNIWIVDCSEQSEPMRVRFIRDVHISAYLCALQQFWASRHQIQHCTPGTDVPRLAVSSSPEEWEKSGRSLFQNKRYLQAMHCFERAGLHREVRVAHTYYLREQARSAPATGSRHIQQARVDAYLAVGEAFLECAQVAVNSKEKQVYNRNAGDCFEIGGDDYRAACAYVEAREVTTAAKLFRKCAKFDEAVDVVQKFRHEVQEDVARNVIDIARLFYFKGGELQ